MHRARETVELLTNATPDFILPTPWPPNSPDLNQMDYKIWTSELSILQSGSGTLAFMHVSGKR